MEQNRTDLFKPSNCLPIDSIPFMPPQHYLFSIVQLRTLSQALHVAADSGIANFVANDKPVCVVELAEKLNFNTMNLRRLMSYLASNGIFTELEGGYFIGNELSSLLRDDVPGNMRDFLTFQGGKALGRALLDMDFSLRTGEPSFSTANGLPFYQYLDKNADEQLKFDNAMRCFNGPLQAAIAAMYDFGRFAKIAELAGGNGSFLKEILHQHPNVKAATLFEREACLANVLPDLLNSPQFKNRFRTVGGDFLTGVDCDADLFIIAQTLHNFNDEDVMKIIGNVAKAMARRPGARLLLVEPNNCEFMPNQPATVSRTLDLLMMCVLNGKERSPEMWRQLLAKCGVQFTCRPPMKIPPMFVAYECQLMASSKDEIAEMATEP